MNQLLEFFSNLPRTLKASLLITIDAISLISSIILAFAVRFDPTILEYQFKNQLNEVFIFIILQLLALLISGFYRSVLRYAGYELLISLLRSVLLGAGLFALLDLMIDHYHMPRSVIVMSAAFSFLSLLSIRLIISSIIKLNIAERQIKKKQRNVVIYGAGSAGIQLFESLRQEGSYLVSAFTDDNQSLQGGVVRGIPVISFNDLKNLHKKNPLDFVLLALPGVKYEPRKNILEKLRTLKVVVRVLPTADQLMRGAVDVSQLQEVDIEDLLGRDEIVPNEKLLHQDIVEKNILVTGAGGSIGKELCREILLNSPKTLILLELNEFALYQIELDLIKNSSIPIVPCLGSVQDPNLVKDLLCKYNIQTVFHAAAYKHVPLVEKNPLEGLKNNFIGTKSIVEKCIETNVSTFVLISTDKAVRPTNVMGASKRISEIIVQNNARNSSKIKFGIVRFGNVLDSSGSVVQLFRDQIKNRQPITVTHPEITRYFMSIGEAVRLVIQAGAMSNNGEVFLLEMGKPVKIHDLAKQMIELSGLIPDKDIPLEYTGLRPGEKLYEELLIDPKQSKPTTHPRIFFSNEPVPDKEFLKKELHALEIAINNYDLQKVFESIKKIIPEYVQTNIKSIF